VFIGCRDEPPSEPHSPLAVSIYAPSSAGGPSHRRRVLVEVLRGLYTEEDVIILFGVAPPPASTGLGNSSGTRCCAPPPKGTSFTLQFSERTRKRRLASLHKALCVWSGRRASGKLTGWHPIWFQK